MITNERQYRITKSRLDGLKKSLESFNFDETLKLIKSPKIVKAQFEMLKSECELLNAQIQDYEILRSGNIEILKASSLTELPSILIKARIAKGLSQKELADRMKIKEQQIQRYEAEEYASANLKRLAEVAKALGISIKEIAEFETIYQVDSGDEFAWDQFPIKEMYKRNWFIDFSGSLSEAIQNGEQLIRDFLALEQPLSSAARQRVRLSANVNLYALLAWQAQVIRAADGIECKGKFNRAVMTDAWFKDLIRLSCEANGPALVVDHLLKAGIRLVFVPHLTGTHLDGAAFLLEKGPVIGMTLRYDRLDNFWFVLIHELIHLRDHLYKGEIESIFDDLDAKADEVEKEADERAGELLISEKVWTNALPRYIQNKEAIEDFAKEQAVHPAIVAGKIRRETANYTILTDLIGQGEVRKHFPSVDFSY